MGNNIEGWAARGNSEKPEATEVREKWSYEKMYAFLLKTRGQEYRRTKEQRPNWSAWRGSLINLCAEELKKGHRPG